MCDKSHLQNSVLNLIDSNSLLHSVRQGLLRPGVTITVHSLGLVCKNFSELEISYIHGCWFTVKIRSPNLQRFRRRLSSAYGRKVRTPVKSLVTDRQSIFRSRVCRNTPEGPSPRSSRGGLSQGQITKKLL